MEEIKEINLKDIKDAIKKVGLDKDLKFVRKFMINSLYGSYCGNKEKVKYNAPNGVKITFKH